MKYEELKEGMKLICNQTNGEKKPMFVARKGKDGFGYDSIVFQSLTSCAQFYCRADEVELWRIEKA